MKDVLFLAWRYLAYHRVKTAILVASITLVLFLPVALQVLVDDGAAELRSRAAVTPLLVGAKGSPLELVLNSLYFSPDVPPSIPFGEAERIRSSGLADAIPLLVRFRVQRQPIVGTTLDYLRFRGLELADGRTMIRIGECVVGASAAAALSVGPGDDVVSSPESVFDLTGVYPLRMKVVGVLAPSHSPDDAAVFVDVKTAWIIQGLLHGHQDLTRADAASGVLTRAEGKIVANASVVEFNEITAANAHSFHSHGEVGDHPVTAVLAVPHDEKSGVLLMGRYQAPDEAGQIVRPRDVMESLLETVVTIQGFVTAGMALVGVATLAVAALVFLLSLRLRRREIETMVKLGGSRSAIGGLVVAEILTVLLVSGALAGALTLLAGRFGGAAVRAFLSG